MAQRAQRCDYCAVIPDSYPVIPAFAGRFALAQSQDLPRRKTRRPQALRQPNAHAARKLRQNRDRPLQGQSHGCQIPTLRLRERLQPTHVGNRPLRMGCARVGARTVAALRETPSRSLRRLRIAHERMARRPGSGAKRAPQPDRSDARTRDRHRRVPALSPPVIPHRESGNPQGGNARILSESGFAGL